MDSLDIMGCHFEVANEEKYKQYEREQAENLQKFKQIQYEKSGVGQKYWYKSLDDYKTITDEQKINKAKIEKYIEDVKIGICRTLWILGNVGTGKTHLASMIIKECGGHFARSYEIDDEVQMSKSFSAKENLVDVINRYSAYKVLVIDEVGRIPSDNEKGYLFRILNNRYEKNLPTVLISNMNKNNFAEYIGKALYDRFTENCTTVSFNGDSYRANERQGV